MADPSSKKVYISIEALNGVLSQTKTIKKKLIPFLANFQQYQMSQIYKTLDYLHQCITKPKAHLKYKFNSLFALKVLLDTSNFVLVNWIEVFFLPHLIEIVKFTIGGQNVSKDFFLKQGYTQADDTELEKFGFNYILLATELIQVGAMIKPFKLFECEPMSTKSDFVLALQELKKAGFKPPEKLSVYVKPEVVQGLIAKYEQGLTEVGQNEQFGQIYAEFSNQKLEEYLAKRHDGQQQKYDISIIQVYESGDLFLSSQAIQICKAEISDPRSALSLENALIVVHRLFLSADYEAFYVVNFQDGLYKTLIDVVDCDKVERGLKRGEKFYAKFGKDSPRIYVHLLDYLQKWAVLSGSFVQEDENFLKKIVTALSQTLNIELPQTSNLETQKKHFQMNFYRNKQRIDRLSEQIQKAPSQLQQVLNHINESKKSLTSVKQSKKKEPIITSSKLQSSNSINTPGGPSEPSNREHPFIKQLNLVEEVYDKFLDDEKNYEKNKAVLEKFLSTFQNEMGSIPESVFEQVSERALNLQVSVEEVLKNDQLKQSANKQSFNAQPSKSQLKPLHESKSEIAAENEVSKPVTLESQTKIMSRQIESQTIIERREEPSKKNIPRQETMKELKKGAVEDTPVKRFESEQSEQNWGKNEADRLGYNNNVQPHRQLEDKMVVSSHKTGTELGYGKPQAIQQNLGPSELGYEQESKTKTNKALPSQKQVRFMDEAQNVPNGSSNPSHKSIRKTEGLSQSRKHIEESSIKSNSKVEHFSPESSQFSQPPPKQFQNSNFKKKLYEEELEVLEEFIEEPLHINKPKEFKSLTGQNRDKPKLASQMFTTQKRPQSQEKLQHESLPSNQNTPQSKVQLQTPENQDSLGFSNKNSHLPITISPKKSPNSNNSIQAQFLELEDIVLNDDYIDPPSINPLEESFHDIGDLETKIKSIINDAHSVPQSNELSFKNCFETDKYILQRQEDKKTKMYWLQSDTTNLVKNILVKKEKSRVSKINVPQILEERNKKYQQELKIVEEEKNKKIQELQGKIKNLEIESEFFKQQAAYHAEEIRTLKANSDFDKQSVGQKGYLKDVENIAFLHKFNSPKRFAYSGIKNFHFDSSRVKQTLLFDPKGKLINSKKFKQSFREFTKEKEKKIMLRSKDLLYKDKEIEVGFMAKKENDLLIITLYITPERDIESLTWKMQCDDALSVESEPNSFITYIRTRKQEKICFTIGVNRLSFTLPIVEFSYTAGEQTHGFRVTLPCAFHKFFFIKESSFELNEHFKRSERIIRGEEVPYSKKILKNLESLKEYFQSMSVLNKGQPNEQGEISYGGMAVYRYHQFPVRISVKPNQFLYVQGIVPVSGEEKTETAIIEYYISTVTHLLMKEMD